MLIIFLMGISVARLLVQMHQQSERIAILEAQVDQLLSDTTRLRIVSSNPTYTQHRDNRDYYTNHRTYNQGSKANAITSSQSSDTTAFTPSQGGTASVHASTQNSETATKFTTPHLFDLNTIDSLTLIRIPGIAARTASTILRQRQRYGGFYSAQQLRDFMTWPAATDYLDTWCNEWFTADAARLLPIAVNQASISQLQRHPYIDHDQAVEISRYRTRHKRIASATELQQLNSFTPEQLQRLLPYLSFE